MRNLTMVLFTIHLITRTIYVLVNGFFNNYMLQPDSIWLVHFGLNYTTNLNFNYEYSRFIASPLYPTLVGVLKIGFGENWNILLIFIQLFLSSLSGLYIFKIGNLLFNKKVGVVSSLIFAVFPLTLWYTNTFSQECIFQVLFILSIYYLIKSIKYNSINSVLLSSVFGSLAYLTKSHVLLFLLFIPVIYLHFYGLKKQTFLFSFVYALVSFLFSIPFGIYTYKIHKQYIISSNGAGYQFYIGNSEVGYKTVVDVPEIGSPDFKRVQNVEVGYFTGSQAHHDSLLNLPQKEKQSNFFREGFLWIKNNPTKFIELKFYNSLFFLTPGVSWRHHSFFYWLLSFFLSFPIYFLAYYAMYKLYKIGNINYVFVFYVLISMLIFSLVWYVQNRFRTITIEPLYIIYASYIVTNIIESKMPSVDKRLDAIADL